MSKITRKNTGSIQRSRRGFQLSIEQPLQWTVVLCFGIIIGVIPGWIAAPGVAVWVLPSLAVIGAGAWLISKLIPQPLDVEAFIEHPLSLRSEADRLRYARPGFVGFVSLYNNPQKLSPEALKLAIDNLDFERLQPEAETSNLRPMIHAVLAHSSQLQHCWLLSTEGKAETPGSIIYARVIAEYLRQEKGLNCTFYYGPQYAIPLDNDLEILQKTYDLLKQVFKESEAFQLDSGRLIVDLTSGIRNMALGMVLACLAKERDIEFVSTSYGEDGRTQGDLTPIIFRFEPAVKKLNR